MSLPSARRSRRCRLAVEQLEDRTLLAVALPFGVATPAGPLAPGSADVYDITVPHPGDVLATVQSSAPGTVLMLIDPASSNVLVQSAGVAGSSSLDVIDQHVLVMQDMTGADQPTDYLLQVQNAGSGPINYTIQATYTQGDTPLSTLPLQQVPSNPFPSLVVGDFNGDGLPDIAVAQSDPNGVPNPGSIQVFLGIGHGSFAAPLSYAVGPNPVTLIAANFQPGSVRLGSLDLAVVGQPTAPGNPATLDILTNRGDGSGTFFAPVSVNVPDLFSVNDQPTDLVAGDFNGDGSPDLAVTTNQPYNGADQPGYVSVFQNTAGTFSLASQLPVDSFPITAVAADFDGDGRDDLVTANFAVNTISVLRGTAGPGLLAPAVTLTVDYQPIGLTVGNFNGDGLPDLAVANFGHTTLPPPFSPSSVSVLFGSSSGSLLVPDVTLSMGANVLAVIAADFNGDGRDDLAAINNGAGTVTVALNNGAGTFGSLRSYAALTGFNPAGLSSRIAAADFYGDGIIDLVTADTASNQVDVLHGNGDGTFAAGQRFSIGLDSDGVGDLVAVDATGDGHPDIVTANVGSQDLSVLRNVGAGQFVQDPFTPAPAGSHPTQAIRTDFNGDGVPDLAVVDAGNNSDFQPGQFPPSGTNSVAILLGVGDGTFQAPTFLAGPALSSLNGQTVFHRTVTAVVGDFNGDGRPDVAVLVQDYLDDANGMLLSFLPSGSLQIFLGLGNGTFQLGQTLTFTAQPIALVSGAFTGGNRIDLAALLQNPNEVLLLVGDGHGDFTAQAPVALPVGGDPTTLVTADFNRDGIDDVAVANTQGNSVSILLGTTSGSFQALAPIAVGTQPVALVTGYLNGDLFPDVVVVDQGSGDVTTLLSQTNALGQWIGLDAVPPLALAGGAGAQPITAVVTDFNNDGFADLAVLDQAANQVEALIGNGDGTFQAPLAYPTGNFPTALVAADFNGDGLPDLAATNGADGNVSVFFNNGSTGPVWNGLTPDSGAFGTFGGDPVALQAYDATGNGAMDILTVNQFGSDVTLILGDNQGDFYTFSAVSTPVRATPVVTDLNGDGVLDTLVLDQAGAILYRQGQASAPGTFDAPVVVNPGLPARDFQLLTTSAGVMIAALDAQDHFISLYTLCGSTFTRQTADVLQGGVPVPLYAGLLPSQLLAANLDGGSDGLADDLVVLDSSNGTLSLFEPDPSGTDGTLFQPTLSSPITLGAGVSDIALDDRLGMSAGPDILVTNQLAGTLTVLVNDGAGNFTVPGAVYQAGAGPYDLTAPQYGTLQSLERSNGVIAASFTQSGTPDALVLNPGSNSLALLDGVGPGLFLNPSVLPVGFASRFIGQGFTPSAVAVGDFTGDGVLDLAVLDAQAGLVHILIGDGQDHFTEKYSLDLFGQLGPLAAGLSPTGINVADVTGPNGGGPDAHLDLLIGNKFGDILILVGQGDGTFVPLRPNAGDAIPLAVANLGGNGQDDFIYANESLDHVSVQYGGAAPSVFQNRANGIFAPGAVQLADLNGDGIPDLIVVNSGNNDVLVYPGAQNTTGAISFGTPQRFFVGTDPVSATVADINGDGVLDLVVANRGSNDLSILFGQGSGSAWSMTAGPRLSSGGSGPTAVKVQDVNSDGIADILVSNGSSDNVSVLAGTGDGFFNDAAPVRTTTGSTPGAIVSIITPQGSGFVVLDTGGSTLTELIGFNGTGFTTVQTINAGGFNPVAIIAFDVNADGFTDLLVANNDTNDNVNTDGTTTGNIVLLEAGGDGSFDEVETFSDPEVPNPSAIELSALHSDEFYATSDGVERAVPFFIELPSPVVVNTPLVPVPNTPLGFEPIVETSAPQQFTIPLPLPEATATTLEDRPTLPQTVTFSGQDKTLSNFDLLLTAEGAKGDDENLVRRWAEALEVAQHTWMASVGESAAAAWQTLAATVQDVEASIAGVVRRAAAALDLDEVEMPDLHWRETGRQMVEIAVGSVRASWDSIALATVPLFSRDPEGSATVALPSGSRLNNDGVQPQVLTPVIGTLQPEPSAVPDRSWITWEAFWLTAAVIGIVPALAPRDAQTPSSEDRDAFRDAL